MQLIDIINVIPTPILEYFCCCQQATAGNDSLNEGKKGENNKTQEHI